MKLKPLYDRVVLKPEQMQEKTFSGIMLPEVAREKSQIGTVVAVGQGASLDGRDHPIQLSVGDRVLYSRFAGTDVKLDGEDLVIIRQVDVLAVIGDAKCQVEGENE